MSWAFRRHQKIKNSAINFYCQTHIREKTNARSGAKDFERFSNLMMLPRFLCSFNANSETTFSNSESRFLTECGHWILGLNRHSSFSSQKIGFLNNFRNFGNVYHVPKCCKKPFMSKNSENW